MRNISIANKLQILPSGKVLVPGCEPTSTVTSTELMAEMREADVCDSALADLDEVLKIIPGAKVILLQNFGGPTHRLLELPPLSVICPCSSYADYYKLIRSVASPATEDDVDDIAAAGAAGAIVGNGCGVIDQGFCRGVL